MTWKGSFSSFVLMVFAVSWVGCETLPPPQPYVCEDDVILLGDTLTISLQGIPDPPPEGQYVVRADGTVNMYRLGAMPAAGRKLSDFERAASEAYIKQGLYKEVTVVAKTGDRFYSVAGEVNNRSRLVYSGHITVLRAIASAGDFTEYANRRKVEITRANGKREVVDCRKAMKDARYDRTICPGDYILVPRSF